MTKQKRGGGKGLDILLADIDQTKNNLDNGLQYLPLDIMQSGKYQPRTDMSEVSLNELASSIQSKGLIQPIVVRPIDDNKYEIIAGERRWRAAKIAALDKVPTLVRDVSDSQAIAIAIIENIQRENLNPMEEANALDRLHKQFSMTHQEVAKAVGRSRSTISNLLRLRHLNKDVKQLVESGELEMGHARSLLALKGEIQSDVAKNIAEKDWSVRETEQFIKRLLAPPKEKNQPSDDMLIELDHIETLLSQKLVGNVSIKHSASGKGKLIIDYADITALKKIVAKIH